MSLLEELEERVAPATTQQIADHIQRTIDSRANSSDLLWSDEHLYKLTPLRCSLKDDSESSGLLMTYFNCLKKPKYRKEKVAHLIAFSIAGLPDVFDQPYVNLFAPVAEVAGGQALDGPKVDLDNKFKEEINDPSDSDQQMVQETNEMKFLNWLLESGSSAIRSTLGIFSLVLLGLYTRKVCDVYAAVNEELYVNWRRFFCVQRPPAKIAIPEKNLARIQKGLRRECSTVGKVLAMCLRKKDEDPRSKFSAAFDCFVAIKGAVRLSSLEFAFDLIHRHKGMREADIQSTITIKKTVLPFEEFRVLWDQYKNFVTIMRYIAYCSQRAKRSADTSTPRLQYYKYAPLIDCRYFQSVVLGNYELRSFLFGFLNGIEECSFFISKENLIETYVVAGETCRLSLEYPGYEEVEAERRMLKFQKKMRGAEKWKGTVGKVFRSVYLAALKQVGTRLLVRRLTL